MKIAVISVFFAASVVLAAPNSSPLQAFSESNNRFSTKVYREILKRENGNFLVSPISAEVILGLTLTGAKGLTAQELSKGLELPAQSKSVEDIFRAVAPTLNRNGRYILSSANKLYVKDNFEVNPNFKTTAVKTFESDIENIDFTRRAEATNKINGWVESKTNNLIHNLLQESDVNEATRLVLVNALYFKGEWVHKFDDVIRGQFHLNRKDRILVDMMSQTNQFNYYEDPRLNAKFLELPYKGDEVSMVIALPNEIDGLQAIENNLEEVFKPKPFKSELVHVQIPQFTVESSIQFKPILENLGVRVPFTPEADFSGIGENLYISKIIQKTFINVTETGTEAAAATAGGIVTLSIPYPEPTPKHTFIANHPFIVSLVHKKIGTLFFGKINRLTTVGFSGAQRHQY